MSLMVVPQGEYTLLRYPLRPKEQLRAWDAADEYLLGAVAGTAGREGDPLDLRGRTLLLNDAFGALSVPLADQRPTMVSDSANAIAAALQNLANNRPDYKLETRASTDDLPFPVDVVLLKVPKSLTLLEHQLRQVREVAHLETVVIASGMARHIHTSTLELFGQILGPTSTSLAKKKARLIFPTLDLDLDPGPPVWPQTFNLDDGMTVHCEPGVFSGGKLDSGTRLLLQNMPKIPAEAAILDLGCGSGILGTAAAAADSHVTFADISYLALRSAEATYRERYPTGDFRSVACDGADDVAEASIDVVLNNPPFHDDQAVAEATAWKMFNDAHRVLKPGGELWVVGNRHLGYHAKLSKLFGNRDTVASSSKFVVLRARKAA